MVIGEADGEGKYRDESAFALEKIREGHLRDLGYDVVRWTGREGFGSPGLVMDRIGRALMAGAGDPDRPGRLPVGRGRPRSAPYAAASTARSQWPPTRWNPTAP